MGVADAVVVQHQQRAALRQSDEQGGRIAPEQPSSQQFALLGGARTLTPLVLPPRVR
jgi:hypothetical protein